MHARQAIRGAFLAAGLCVTAARAGADGCPVAPDHDAALEALIAQVQAAPNQQAANALSNRMWAYWLDAPDFPSQQMLDAGMLARSAGDFDRAMDRFDTLVGYCPFYAEGYNQRAFTLFLRGAYARALPDLDRALDLSPRHVGALSGRALTLMRLGRQAEGQAALRAALAVNPWLGERALLDDSGRDP